MKAVQKGSRKTQLDENSQIKICSTESQAKCRLLCPKKQQGLLGVEWAAVFRLNQGTMVMLTAVIWVLIIYLKKNQVVIWYQK